VIVVDLNVLIYAHNATAPEHDRMSEWAESAFSGKEKIGIDWAVVHGFLRLTTRGPVLATPFTIDEAVKIVNSWFDSPAVEPVVRGPRYWPIFQQLLVSGNIRGAMVSDAHIAAVALEHDATLYTTDRDFRLFPGLRIINPLGARP
jgi:uncharacterized protein